MSIPMCILGQREILDDNNCWLQLALCVYLNKDDLLLVGQEASNVSGKGVVNGYRVVDFSPGKHLVLKEKYAKCVPKGTQRHQECECRILSPHKPSKGKQRT
jgi:hypothetical protein